MMHFGRDSNKIPESARAKARPRRGAGGQIQPPPEQRLHPFRHGDVVALCGTQKVYIVVGGRVGDTWIEVKLYPSGKRAQKYPAELFEHANGIQRAFARL